VFLVVRSGSARLLLQQGGIAVDLDQPGPGLGAAFARGGVACVRGVLDLAGIAAAVAAIEAVLAVPGPLAQVASGLGDPGSRREGNRVGRSLPQCRADGLLGGAGHLAVQPVFLAAAGSPVTSDGLRGCGRLCPDAERGQQMLMQLGEFGGDQAGFAGLLLGSQPQHPVPEVVIDAGQGGRGDMPCWAARQAARWRSGPPFDGLPGVEVTGRNVELAAMLANLTARGIGRLFAEGGTMIHTRLTSRSDLVQYLKSR
jgi:hypothetical protein